jgi:hypothetical protein
VTEQIVSMVSFARCLISAACRCFSRSRHTSSGIVGMDLRDSRRRRARGARQG